MHSSDSTSDTCVCVCLPLDLATRAQNEEKMTFLPQRSLGCRFVRKKRSVCVCRVAEIQKVANGKVIISPCDPKKFKQRRINTLRQIRSSRTSRVSYILGASQYVNYFYFFQNSFLKIFFFPDFALFSSGSFNLSALLGGGWECLLGGKGVVPPISRKTEFQSKFRDIPCFNSRLNFDWPILPFYLQFCYRGNHWCRWCWRAPAIHRGLKWN